MRPDLVVVKKNYESVIIDVAVPGDFRVIENEIEDIIEHQELEVEINKVWHIRTKVIPIVIVALRAEPTFNIRDFLALPGVKKHTVDIIDPASGSVGIGAHLEKVLSIPA